MERSIPSDTATRVRRQTISVDMGGGLKVQDLTVKQDCDGILLQWNRLNLPHRCVKLSKRFRIKSSLTHIPYFLYLEHQECNEL